MRLIVQRVTQASVTVEEECISQIGQGLLIFVGVEKKDTEEEIKALAQKISRLRIFEDENHKMNLSIKDINGSILSVSQFTLLANTKRGNRPSFGHAEEPKQAEKQYQYFNTCLEEAGIEVKIGRFGSDMDVALHNDGPVTLFFDTREGK